MPFSAAACGGVCRSWSRPSVLSCFALMHAGSPAFPGWPSPLWRPVIVAVRPPRIRFLPEALKERGGGKRRIREKRPLGPKPSGALLSGALPGCGPYGYPRPAAYIHRGGENFSRMTSGGISGRRRRGHDGRSFRNGSPMKGEPADFAAATAARISAARRSRGLFPVRGIPFSQVLLG